MLDELFPDVAARSAVIFECLQNSIRDKVNQQTLALRGTAGGVIFETIFSVSKVMTLLIHVVFGDLIVLGRLCKYKDGCKT